MFWHHFFQNPIFRKETKKQKRGSNIIFPDTPVINIKLFHFFTMAFISRLTFRNLTVEIEYHANDYIVFVLLQKKYEMNLLFPSLNPRLLDSHWFTADSPCDEESDVAAMEQKYQAWLASIGQRYIDILPLGKSAPEPMEEEAETDEEEGNDDSDDTEDSHDEDEEEELGAEYSPSAPNPTEATNAMATVPTTAAAHHLPNNNNDIVMNDSNINI